MMRQSMMVARDELELRPSPSSGSGFSAGGASFGGCPGADPTAAEGGTLSTLRRSLRQMNPFKSRLFRLPATPRLSRSKKVLARGEESTGWNFERPGAASCSSQCPSLLRPYSSSFGAADSPHSAQHRRLSHMMDDCAPLQPSPAAQRRIAAAGAPLATADECSFCGDANGNGTEVDGLDDLDEFLAAMESIARRGVVVGGSCRVQSDPQQPAGRQQLQRKGGTVAAGMLPGPGSKRTRAPIPSFNCPAPLDPPPPAEGVASAGRRHCAPPARAAYHHVQPHYYQFLPSTCYAPDGEMYAARWHPSESSRRSVAASAQQSPRPARRPMPIHLEGGAALLEQPGPKSPSQSTITLLNTAANAQVRTMRSASTGGSNRHQQNRPSPLNGLFPQTQFQRRRVSACSVAVEREGKAIAEEQEEQPASEAALLGGANYYGRDVLRLMQMRGEQRRHNGVHTPKEKGSPWSLLPHPPLLFPFADELALGGPDPFVGREWLFKELCHQFATDGAQLVLLQGASGCGKSAVLRHVVAHSHVCAKEQSGHEVQQHNTVDSGIAFGASGPGSGANSGGTSSGSQLSLLNLSSALPSDPLPALTPGSACASHRSYEWLDSLAKHVVAFHFAHLHSALSCSIAEFVRSLCAQMCAAPQLRSSYGRLIRSCPLLHRLASQEASLGLEPVELFRTLIARPLAQIYRRRKQQQETDPDKVSLGRRSSSKGSDYGSQYGSGDRPCADPVHPPSFVLVLVDALDEASFHRTDGGESIGWLLRRVLPECPSQLRFLCTAAQKFGAEGSASAIFGTIRDGERPLEAMRSVRLDDWEMDERVQRDVRLFVEQRTQTSPALEKLLAAQSPRPSSANPTPTDSLHSHLVAQFGANFVSLQLALGMLAEGRIQPSAVPDPGELFPLLFRQKFPSGAHFRPFASLLSVLLASLRPLSVEELHSVLAAEDKMGLEELKDRLAQLSPVVVRLASPCSSAGPVFVPFHASLREWLLKEGANPDAEFAIDIRHGHILLALSLVNRQRHSHSSSCALSAEQLFELAHHLLKANPHKYMCPELAAQLDMPIGRDAQVQWLRMAVAGECGLRTALLCRRNVFYPNAKVSRLLLLAGADPNAAHWPDWGPDEPLLCTFARADNQEMVHLLLQFGANSNPELPLCTPPLIVAVQQGHEQVARILCANGADLCARDAEGRGALFHAAAADSLPMLAFLLDEMGDAENGKAAQKRGPSEQPQHQLLRAAASTADSTANHRYSACSSFEDSADANNSVWKVRAQSAQEAARIDRQQAIREAFELAAERGSARVCRHLLDCTDAVLDTSRAMCIACANGRSEVVQFLLSRGATLAPEQTWNGKSALVCAVESGSWDLVVSVLNGSAHNVQQELNAQTGPDRLSPLMVAARHGHVGLVDLLVNRGAHLDAVDAHGRTAAMHAIEAGHSSTVALLLERGCNLFVRDGHGNTMMHLLARHPNKCLINRLLETGLSLEDKNREDLRPIEVAIQAGQLLAVDTFLRRGARLRSLTWQIALAAHPPLVLVLLRKLLDDAQILLRRKRNAEAQHRFNYALQKCDELLAKAGDGKEGGDAKVAAAPLASMRVQLRRYKVQTLHSMAALKRRTNDLREAIALASSALEMLGEEQEADEAEGRHSSGEEDTNGDEAAEEQGRGWAEQRFELHLLRAKCHFDARHLDRARVDAQLAACLRPGDQEAQNLVAVLSMNAKS